MDKSIHKIVYDENDLWSVLNTAVEEKWNNLTISGDKFSFTGEYDIDSILGIEFTKTIDITDLTINKEKIIKRVITYLQKHSSIRFLCIVGCNLNSLPSNISSLEKLEFLRISSNSLRGLPANISKLRLRGLDLGTNKLNEFPKELLKINSLEYLRLSSNTIMHIPKEIYKLDNLRYLRVKACSLIEIPEEILKIRGLTELHIHYNNMLGIPIEIEETSDAKIILDYYFRSQITRKILNEAKVL